MEELRYIKRIKSILFQAFRVLDKYSVFKFIMFEKTP